MTAATATHSPESTSSNSVSCLFGSYSNVIFETLKTLRASLNYVIQNKDPQQMMQAPSVFISEDSYNSTASAPSFDASKAEDALTQLSVKLDNPNESS